MVGARRFELPTPCAQGRCATRLRYAPSRKPAVILHVRCPKSSLFCASNQVAKCRSQSLERLAAMADVCLGFAVNFAESLAHGWIKKDRVVAKTVLTVERVCDAAFANFTRAPIRHAGTW